MRLVAYYRVSTASQERKSPGLEAQRLAVERLQKSLEKFGVVLLIGSFTEIESRGSKHRPQLTRALALARNKGAALVVARLYQLGRDADLLQRLADETEKSNQKERAAQAADRPWKGMQGVLFADLPAFHCKPDLLAEAARFDREARGKHTREDLAVARARGARLGGSRPATQKENARTQAAAVARAEGRRPILAPLAAEGASLRRMAEALYRKGDRTKKGEPLSPTQVKRDLARLGLSPQSVPVSTI